METVRLITFGRPLALEAADQLGLFEREGLRVDVEITRGSVEQIRGLRAGTWDLAHTAADNVMAYVNRDGADLFIFLVADLGLAQNLYVQPTVQRYEDLRGTTVGVDALDTGYAFVVRKMMQRNGLELDRDYRFVSVGGPGQRLEALRAGTISAGVLAAGHENVALAEGFRLLDRGSAHFPEYPGLTAATTRAWAREHDALLHAYTRAIVAGAVWASDPANRPTAIDLIARSQGVSRDEAEARFETERAARSPENATPERVRRGLEAVRDLRREMTGVGYYDLERYYDPTYADAAWAALAR